MHYKKRFQRDTNHQNRSIFLELADFELLLEIIVDTVIVEKYDDTPPNQIQLLNINSEMKVTDATQEEIALINKLQQIIHNIKSANERRGLVTKYFGEPK